MSENISCSQQSLKAGEHLYGTAPEVQNWFVLEYPEHWKSDVTKNNNLSDTVKNYFENLLGSFENSRLQFIKKSHIFDGEYSFYFATSTEFEPKLYKFSVNNYDDLLDINIQNLIESNEISKFESNERLVLICTHGTYDSCCGKHGVQIFNEIKDDSRLSVWHTTHVGAHRFSANLVMLPEGIYYGRVNYNNIDELISSHLNHEVYLDCFRGRSCYTQTSQVSDYFLRDKIDKKGIYDIAWEFERDRDSYTSVEFHVESENLTYSVNSMVLNNALAIPASCGDTELKKIPQFYFYSLVPYTPKDKEA